MDSVLLEFKAAQLKGDGYALAAAFSPVGPAKDPGRLYRFYKSTSPFDVQNSIRAAIVYDNDLQLDRNEATAWVDAFVAYWKAVGAVLAAEEAHNSGSLKGSEWGNVYENWKDLANCFIKNHTAAVFPAWTLPCLYLAGRYLRLFAIKADGQANKEQGNVTFSSTIGDDIVATTAKNERLEDAARQLSRIFQACAQDRSPIEESRKWGIYYTCNLLFKTHFKLNSISLSKNLLRTIQAQKDLPDLTKFPKSHQVTFNYYAGVIAFLEEDYVKSEAYLTEAWNLCHKDAHKNRELILTYLIPCHLLTTHTLPTKALLEPYPQLQELFGPLAACIKRGDLVGYDKALLAGETAFVKRRIYLTLERAREIALRNLFRKVFLAGGFDPLKDGETEANQVRRTRLPISEFVAAMQIGIGAKGDRLDPEEVECLVANQIYKVGGSQGFGPYFRLSHLFTSLSTACKSCLSYAN